MRIYFGEWRYSSRRPLQCIAARVLGAFACAIMLSMLPGKGEVARFPEFDSHRFCNDLRVPILSTYPGVVYQMCMEQENGGRERLRKSFTKLDPDHVTHCRMIVEQRTTHGSYWLFESCIRHP